MPWLSKALTAHCLIGAAEAFHGAIEVSESGGYAMGLSMLGGIVLTMGLWHFAHWPDVDVRRATWTVISSTTSIFCAVLMFSFGNEFFNEILFERFSEGGFEHKRYLNQVEVMVCYSILFLSLARRCGLGCGNTYRQCILKGQRPEGTWQQKIFPCWKDTDKDKAEEEYNTKMKQEAQSYQWWKSYLPKSLGGTSGQPRSWLYEKSGLTVSLMWAHACGFAGIAGWGMVQTNPNERTYYESPLSSATLIPEAFFKWFFVLIALKAFRDSIIDGNLQTFLARKGWCSWLPVWEGKANESPEGQEKAKEEDDWADGDKLIDQFKDQIADGENDMYGLFVSFLIVQSLRFAIGGVLPNEEGKELVMKFKNDTIVPAPSKLFDCEEEECQTPLHVHSEILSLYGVGLILMVIGCFVPVIKTLIVRTNILQNLGRELEKWIPDWLYGEVKDVVERVEDIMKNICFMSWAWCMMYATEWLIIYSGVSSLNSEDPKHPKTDIAAQKVLLATACTLLGFAIILAMDAIADQTDRWDAKQAEKEATKKAKLIKESQQSQNKLTESFIQKETEEAKKESEDKQEDSLRGQLQKAPREIMKYVGFLIGFSWENAFDNAVEGVTDTLGENIKTRCLLTTIIGLGSIAIILPAWHNYILPMTVTGHGHLFGTNPHQLLTRLRKLRYEVDKKPQLHKWNDLMKLSIDSITSVLKLAQDTRVGDKVKVIAEEEKVKTLCKESKCPWYDIMRQFLGTEQFVVALQGDFMAFQASDEAPLCYFPTSCGKKLKAPKYNDDGTKNTEGANYINQKMKDQEMLDLKKLLHELTQFAESDEEGDEEEKKEGGPDAEKGEMSGNKAERPGAQGRDIPSMSTDLETVRRRFEELETRISKFEKISTS